MKSLRAAGCLWIVLGAVLLPLFLPLLNADGTSYISIAEKYARGDFRNAVNGYWGPLLSWLSAPLIALGLGPVAAARIVILAAGLLLLWAVRRISGVLGIEEPLSSALLFACLPVGLYMAFTMITPDFLVAALLLAYLAVFLEEGFPRRRMSGAACGALGALAFLAKPFAFFFFLAHFCAGTAVRFLSRRSSAERRRLLSAGLLGLAVFALLAGAWIGVISLKYGHLFINAAGRYNMAYLRPGSPGQPIQTGGFLPPPNATATSAWEDPELLALPEWSPIGTVEDRSYYGRLLHRNFGQLMDGLQDFSRLGPVIFLAGLALAVIAAIRRFASRRLNVLAGLTATLLLYSGGYVLLLVEDRYLWLDAFLMMILAAGLLSLALSRSRGRRWLGAAAGIPVLATFLVLPVGFFPKYRILSASDTRIPAPATRRLALRLKADYNLQGRMASSGRWNESLFIASFDRLQYFGQMRPGWSGAELEEALIKNGIRYFFLWRDNDPKFEFLKNYIELTKGGIPDLEIYLMKRRPDAVSRTPAP
jgi:hypothetical protein